MSEDINHNDLYRAIGNLEGKMNTLIKHSEERNGRYDKVEQRVRLLEKNKWIQQGIHATVLTLLTFIGWDSIKGWFN